MTKKNSEHNGELYCDTRVGGVKRWYYKEEVIYSTTGTPYRILRAYEVARIDDNILDAVFYLYPSVEAAEAGEQESGGTGFFVGVASEVHPHQTYIYAVSNDHVVHAPGYSPVIRRNQVSRENLKTDGRVTWMAMIGNREIIPLAINQWKPHHNGDDIAIAPLGRVDDRTYRYHYRIPSFTLMTRDVIDAFDIGPGDDVYMVGRFIHHEGEHFNLPSVRSGIISVMPYEGIEFDAGGFKQEAFLIEMRSISGYSGSPVIWKLPLFDVVVNTARKIKPESKQMIVGPYLLGIDCGNFKYYDPVYEVREEDGQKNYEETNLEAKSHSGQAIVIPAWKLEELLNLEEFDMARKEEDKKLTEAKRNSPVERDVAKPQEKQGMTHGEYMDFLKQVSRKTSEPESEKNET